MVVAALRPIGARLLANIDKTKHLRFDGSVLRAQVDTPLWNPKAVTKFGKRQRRAFTPTQEGFEEALSFISKAQKNAYTIGGKTFKPITSKDFLKELKKSKGLTETELANKLHKAGFMTEQNRLFRGNKSAVQKIKRKLGESIPRRTVKEAIDIVKTAPGGKAFVKSYKEGIYTEKQLRQKATNVLKGDEVSAKKVQKELLEKVPERGVRGTNPNSKVFGDMIRATQQGGRIKFVKGNINSPQKDIILKDMQASYKGGRLGGKQIKLSNLDDFMENSVGNGLGKGSYERAAGSYEFQNLLRQYPVTYRGEEMKMGNFLSARGYLPEDARSAFFEGKKVKSNNPFNVEHIEGVGNNPYLTRISTERSNKGIEDALKNADRIYKETKNPQVAFDALIKDVENRGLTGIQRTAKFGDETFDVSTDFSLKGLFRQVADELEPRVPGGFGRTLMAAARRLEKDPVYTDKFKPLLQFVKNGGLIEDLSEPATDLERGFLNSADIEAEMEMARVLDNKIITAPEAQKIIIERFKNNFRDGGLAREDFQVGGAVGGGIGGGIGGAVGQNSRIGNIQSVLAGIAAGVIDIPKGVFSLGASLMDLGLGTSTAAKVENFFDNLTTFDETAEARTAGQIARIITNLGIPGSQAWKVGTGLARKAMFAKNKDKYFTASDPKLPPKIDDALNAKGRLYATLGGAAGIGVADAIFVGDPEQVGTLGDAFEFGPTQLRPNNENDAAREIMNRLKFGLDSSLLLGLVGGSGSAIKSMIKRRNELESNNDFIDKILSKIRPRGEKPMEFFRLERESIGIRAGDVNRAQEISRGVDRHIDGMFPFLKPIYEKATIKSRADLMKSLNDALLSGKTDFGVGGKINFGPMDEALVKVANEKMKALGAKPEAMKGILNLFDEIRTEWGDMFTALGSRMDEKSYGKFSAAFSKKMTDYLGSTYDVFRNKSLIPMLNFKAGEEAVTKLVNLFKKTAADKGEELTTEQARHYVDQIVESATPGGRGLPIREDATAGVYFKGNKLFEDLVDKSILGDVEFNPKVIQLNTLKPEAKAAIDEVLGKIQDPIQTILQGTQKLSLITRRNQFFDELLESSNKAKADNKKGFFYEDEAEAFAAFGKNIKRIDFDPSKTLEAGVTNPLNGLYAPTGVANALEETSKSILDRLGTGSFATMYQNFILYPKATSQLAKTVLSPITHMRNLFSASAFAAANGLLPGFIGPDEIIKNMKSAYGKLQFGRADDPVANKEYRKLLRLGVVNSNVSLGDLSRLLEDVKFGENITATSGAKGLMRQFSKLKRAATDLYTAEDDLWKIYTFATERGRFEKAFKRAGIAKSADELDEMAADIVRNNVPNYDYVSDFIKGLRQFPIGNFVSFPAEIMRTSVNIMTRGLKEFNDFEMVNGVKVHPLRNIGLQRLFGFAATTTVIPYGLVEGAKAVYNVSGVEMDALRRFVPEWSKNSTIIPVRGDDGELKYVDFSHANAYDTMIRPVTTLINNIRDGQLEEEAISKSILQGVFEATKELGQPFISEAIWTEAATDIIVRGGRTRDGRRLYTEQTPNGEKAMAIVGHLVDSQLPGSIEQFKRFDLAIEPIDIIQKGKFDKYGRDYKLSDELFGIIGMRAVEVDPVNSMKFKIADFTRGISNSRREFTSPLLRGGVVTPEQIVDRYQIANNQLYKVQREMFRDYYAARTLGAKETALDREFKDRVSRVSLAAIKSGRFKPFIPSENIIKSFGENARQLGQRNPYLAAKPVIDRITRQFNNLPLILEDFPIIPNPFSITQPTLPTSGINTGLPNLNLGLSMPTATGTTGNTIQKGQTVFGPLDPVFGSS